LTSSGRFVVNVTVESADGLVKISIPKDTVGKNQNGQSIRYIAIKKQSTPPDPPTDCKFVCLTYDIGFIGTTFNPPINLAFKYNDSQVPAGVAEDNLLVATWQDGKWVELEGCVVDAVNNTITVPVSHFSLFTVIAYTSAANFAVSELNVTPAEILPGENVNISALITNSGDLTGNYNVVLKINNTAVQNK
jgi:hypothetical protein